MTVERNFRQVRNSEKPKTCRSFVNCFLDLDHDGNERVFSPGTVIDV